MISFKITLTDAKKINSEINVDEFISEDIEAPILVG